MSRTDFSNPVSGPAYGRASRIAATLLVLLVLLQGGRALDRIAAEGVSHQTWIVLGSGVFVLLASYLVMVRSATTIDARGLRQTGLLEKRVDWAELRNARVGGFAFARRLWVRTETGKFKVFFAGTPQLAAAFERIAAAYPAK